MNIKILALSLVTISGLMAQESSPPDCNEQTSCCNICCTSPCSCNPCCPPKEKNCIDCKCYTPQFYDLQCPRGFFADLEFLYWYAKETDLSYALKYQSTLSGSTLFDIVTMAPKKYKSLDARWTPGLRLGLGWDSECDGWDCFVNWTYFFNNLKGSISVPDVLSLNTSSPFLPAEGEELLLNPWMNQSAHWLSGLNSLLTFEKVSATWRLIFNQIDLELGRKYWLSPRFNLRPFTGLRGAWIRVDFEVNSFRDQEASNIFYDFSLRDRFKTHNWGAGLVGGIQPTWYFYDNIALYGNLDAALIWGSFEVAKIERYSGTASGNILGSDQTIPFITYNNRSSNKFSQMNAMVDLALGLRWEEYWCCNRYRSNLDLGWEHHIWFNQNHRNKSYGFFLQLGTPNFAGFQQYEEASGDLGMGGLVVRLRFDW